jgi:hypothetical protein
LNENGYTERGARESGWIVYSGRRRHDPELKAKVRRVIDARQDALSRAAELVGEAKRELDRVSMFLDDGIVDRNVTKVRSLWWSLDRAAQFKAGIGSETYVENLAAGPLGEQIEAMGDGFPLKAGEPKAQMMQMPDPLTTIAWMLIGALAATMERRGSIGLEDWNRAVEAARVEPDLSEGEWD